jgi:hypothetical protein
MVRGVVHQAIRAAVVTIGRLMGAFVAFQPASALTRRCSCGSGRFGQRLVTAGLLLLLLVVAATLGLSPSTGLTLPPCYLGDWGVPGVALRSLGTVVRQAEEHRNILNVMGGEFLQHLLIPHSLMKCNHHKSIGDMRNDIANLREPLDKGAQGFPRAFLDGVEIGLVTRSSISALEVDGELAAQL